MSTDKRNNDTNAECGMGYGTATVAFLVGATAGVAAGILLAPRATEFVSDIQATAADMKRRGYKAVDEAVVAGAMDAHEALDTTVNAVRQGAKKGHDAINTAAAAMHTTSPA